MADVRITVIAGLGRRRSLLIQDLFEGTGSDRTDGVLVRM
jgi:hypothetical protein